MASVKDGLDGPFLWSPVGGVRIRALKANGCEAVLGLRSYATGMTAKSINVRQLSSAFLILLVLIVAKCLVVPWAIAHWSVPIHAAWVIVPTLVFAGIVTALVLLVRE